MDSHRRALRDAARVAIADIRDGAVVKVAGHVRYADFTVTAPDGRACCWYRDGEHSDGRSFYVDDGSGVAYVHAPGMEVLDRLILVEGDRVAVRGAARWLDNVEPSPRAPAGRLLLLHAREDLPLVVGADEEHGGRSASAPAPEVWLGLLVPASAHLPRVTIAEAEDYRAVAVHGRVRGEGPPLLSPTGIPCRAWCHWQAKAASNWPFFSRLEVDYLLEVGEAQVFSIVDGGAAVRVVVDEMHIGTRGRALGNGRYEATVADGDRVEARGLFKRLDGGAVIDTCSEFPLVVIPLP